MSLILQQTSLSDTLDTNFYLDSHKNYLEIPDISLARTYERLGTIYFTKCMYDLSMENFIQAQTILSKDPDTFQDELARIYNNIGVVLHKRSEYNEAISSFKKSMDLLASENEGKGKEKELGACQENLGFELSIKGSFQDSLYNLKKAYVLKKNTYGEKHALVADNLTKMGSLFNRMGKYSKALEYLERAENMKQECQSNSTETINIYEELAKVYINQVECVQALDNITKAFNIKQENFEPEHFLFAKTYVLQGNLHRIQGQYKEAIDSFKKALEIQRKKVNSLHPEIGDTYYQLGHAYSEDGQFKEAADCYGKSLKSFEMNYGGENPRTKKAKERMEKCVSYVGKNEDSMRKMSSSVSAWSQGEQRRDEEIRFGGCPHTMKGSVKRKESIIQNACTLCGIRY